MKETSMRSTYSYIAPLKKRTLATALCSVLLALIIIAAVVVYMHLPNDSTSDHYSYIFALLGVPALALIVFMIILIATQEKINRLFSSLLIVMEYNSRYLYRFYRQQALSQRPITSIVFAAIALLCALCGIVINATPSWESVYAAYLFYAAAACLLLAVLFFPYIRSVINFHFCKLLGKDKHIAISRRGIINSRRILDFGNNSFTFFKAEARRVGSFDCISFYYHKRRGYSLEPAVYNVPLPYDADAEMVQELLDIFNSSDLFMNSRPEYMM